MCGTGFGDTTDSEGINGHRLRWFRFGPVDLVISRAVDRPARRVALKQCFDFRLDGDVEMTAIDIEYGAPAGFQLTNDLSAELAAGTKNNCVQTVLLSTS